MRTHTPIQTRGGFTLIEIMIVVAIVALVVAVGVPAMFRVAEKDSLRQVVVDIVEACDATRQEAILQGSTQTLVVNQRDRTITAPGRGPVKIPERIEIEIMAVNFVDVKDLPGAPVRFFANSMSDEFTVVLRSEKNEQRRISLEIVTALADVESDPMKIMQVPR